MPSRATFDRLGIYGGDLSRLDRGLRGVRRNRRGARQRPPASPGARTGRLEVRLIGISARYPGVRVGEDVKHKEAEG